MGPDFKPRERNNGGGGGAGALPTTTSTSGTRSRIPKGRQIQKTFNNVKITILCGFVTILVLRGTIGVGDLGRGSGGGEEHKAVEDIDRILREIRTDSDPDDIEQSREQQQSDQPPDLDPSATNSTSSSQIPEVDLKNLTYKLGPKISDWDEQRRQWLAKNPSFPSEITASLGGGRIKPRILLVTGSPPNPCDNPIGDHYLLKAIKNKIDYCRLHDMEIVYNMAHLDTELAGYWAKLPLLRRLLLSHPEAEWVWWLDSDALFTDMSFELPLEKYSGKNLVIHGYPDLVFEQRSWISLNTGSFLLRNCQWSLDLLDAWAPMGPKGAVREAAGKLLTAELKGRPAFEADDQSALIYLLLSEQERWFPKTFIENSYYLHGYWPGLVDRYEEMMERHHPGLGDDRWPFVTHFVGCKPCGSYGDYPVERCLKSMERAFNFADNQVLHLYGFSHRVLSSTKIRRFRNESASPLEVLAEEEARQVSFLDQQLRQREKQ